MKSKLKYPLAITIAVSSLASIAVAEDASNSAASTPASPGATSGAASSGAAYTNPTSSSLHPDGIVMSGGEVHFVKHGQPQRVDRELKLSEGITVQKNGNVTLKDGRSVTLTDGQMVTLEGQVISTPPTLADSIRNRSSSGTTGTQSTDPNSLQDRPTSSPGSSSGVSGSGGPAAGGTGGIGDSTTSPSGSNTGQ